MEPEDVIQLFEHLENINNMFETLISAGFLLTGLIAGVLLVNIFFYFLKGAE
jgi:high-affinity nickel permease